MNDNKLKISVSILGADRKEIERAKRALEDVVDMWHVDVMDGNFVENIREYEEKELVGFQKPLDFHFMVDDVMEYLSKYEKYFHITSSISFHSESQIFREKFNDLVGFMERIKNNNPIEFGLAINPRTLIDEELEKKFLSFDYVLVMSVVPGKSGQKFMPEIVEKVARLEIGYPHLPVRVDGGINVDSLPKLKKYANLEAIAVGSYITKSEDPMASFYKLKS